VQFLVVARPRDPVPPEMIQMLTDGSKQWYERYKDRFEAFGNFASGGGFGVVNADNEQDLFRMIWEMPFIPLSDVTVDVVWPGPGAFDFVADVARQMTGGSTQGA
jgi:hypothetical protein